MKKTINYSEFADAFRNYDRIDQFPSGLPELFNYLEELEADLGTEIELDVIGFCCDYAEYSDMESFRRDYGDRYQTIEDIENDTTIILVDWDDDEDDGSFIIQLF